jgi:plastocyanin domain-containing protein
VFNKLRFHIVKASLLGENSWVIIAEIALVAIIFFYLYFKKRTASPQTRGMLQRIEVRLANQTLSPIEIRIESNRPTQLLIHRLDREPDDELFEIEDLDIYELLPALHTTIISFQADKRGKFKMVLAGQREAGVIIVI